MKLLISIFIILTPLLLLGQNQVEVVQGNTWEYDDAIAPGAQRLIGLVVLAFDDVTLSCDSAYVYENNNFTAFHNIHINQGDSIHLYGDQIDYTYLTESAILRDNVLFKDKDMTLKTDYLNYDLNTCIGSYSNGGDITSTENNNTLSSSSGSYDSDIEMFYFRENVILSNPEYTVKSDTLHYNNASEISYFFGPTTILGEDSEIYCENGWYNTQNEICQFSENASITSETTLLKGDSIYYDGAKKYGEAFRNVMISDSVDKFTITGEYGFHDQLNDSSFVVGKAVYIQDFEKDSLFLHADTLLAVSDSIGQNIIRAFNRVKFYKTDIQGKADSLVWLNSDSLIQMFYEPIVWNEANQMAADTISIKMKGGNVHQLLAKKNAFISSDKGAGKFDQIKGRELVGHFKNNELYKLDMLGNGQAVYYPIQEKNGLSSISSVNKIDCSDIVIFMKDSSIERIKFLTKPKGAMLPITQAVTSDEKLKDFKWHIEKRPKDQHNLFPED